PFRIGSVLSGQDTHTQPVIHIDNNGLLYFFQENLHDTPIDIYKGHFNFVTKLTEKIGTELSYCNMLKDASGNGILWSRGDKLTGSEDDGYHQYVTKASSGFESWGTPLKVTENPDPIPFPSQGSRHYPIVPQY